MQEYKISKQLVEAVLQYLITRPYREIHQLINALQSIEEIKKETKEKIIEKKEK